MLLGCLSCNAERLCSKQTYRIKVLQSDLAIDNDSGRDWALGISEGSAQVPRSLEHMLSASFTKTEVRTVQ